MDTAAQVIARRILNIKDEPEKCVSILLERPVAEGDDFRCNYSIDWSGTVSLGYAVGVDELQALLLAISHLSADIRTSTFAKEGRLFWLEIDNGIGFPDIHVKDS
ncbi:MAG: hypothetical protein ABL907_21735 [Hyphomicrobium sp.]